MKLGKNVARTFLDYYKLNSLIDENKLTSQFSRFVLSMMFISDMPLCFTDCLFQKVIFFSCQLEHTFSDSIRNHQEIVLKPLSPYIHNELFVCILCVISGFCGQFTKSGGTIIGRGYRSTKLPITVSNSTFTPPRN